MILTLKVGLETADIGHVHVHHFPALPASAQALTMQVQERFRFSDLPQSFKLLTGVLVVAFSLISLATAYVWQTSEAFSALPSFKVLSLLLLGIMVMLVAAWIAVAQQFAYFYYERQHAMRTISESETRNIALLHALPDMMFLIDREGTFLDYHARDQQTGIQGAPYVGRNLSDALPGEIGIRMMAAVEEVICTGAMRALEYDLADPTDGTAREQAFEARIVSCGEDRALAIVRNITDREEAEEAIREAENKFRILVEQSLTGIYIIQDGRLAYVNPRFAEIFGYAPDEVTAFENVADLIAPDDRTAFRESIEGRQESFHLLVRGLCKDGGIIFGEVYGSVTEYKGRAAIIGTLLDVTKQREAQEKLRVLGMAVEQSAEGVLVIDTNGIVRFVNPAWARMHDFTVGEVTGAHFRIFHTEEQMRREVFPVINRFEKMHVYRAEMGHKRKDGTTFPSSTAFATLKDDNGHVIGAVGICRDITEQKRYEADLLSAKERAEEMSRLKSVFLTNMSHEIRTPLTGIIGFATVLEEEVPEAQQEFAHLIRTSGDRLMQTLNAVLDLARLEAGEMTLVPQMINLRTEIQEATGLFRGMASAKNLGFSVSYSDAVMHAKIDPSVLAVILNNLVGNAIKFTDAGEVHIDARTSEDEVRITVSDTGIGIDKKFIPYLFDEFKQESAGLTRSHEGSGLGLSITMRLVHLMGGRIEVDSAKDQGSVFTVIFPRFSAIDALPNVA